MSNQELRLEVSVEDGKYTVIMESDGRLHALRYGEPWRELSGDKFVYCLAAELDQSRNEVADLKAKLAKAEENAAMNADHAANYLALRNGSTESNFVIKDLALRGFQNVAGVRLDALCQKLRATSQEDAESNTENGDPFSPAPN